VADVISDAVVPVALLVAGLNVLVGALGAWRWVRGDVHDDLFWRGVRAGQALALAFALVAALAAVTGSEPDDGLFWLYALLPLAVSFVAEQLRIVSAQTELDARGLESAQAMRGLGDADQRDIVAAIARRELGVMAIAAGVVAFLVLRAAGTWA
jgi:hypothetical protein